MGPCVRAVLGVFTSVLFVASAWARCPDTTRVCPEKATGAAPLIINGRPASVVSDTGDHAGVLRAARNLEADLAKVAGVAVAPTTADGPPTNKMAVIVGTLGHSKIIDGLVRGRRLDVTGVAGTWEAYLWQVIERPMPGVDRALVIAGSDKRGTIFGIYELSNQIGVSPWYWWADVPVKPAKNLYTPAGRQVDWPRVRYRGIFLNDEAPALTNWAAEKYGGLNHQFYERVFDLILRQKANYLWPAMWGKSLYDDDPRSGALADEMGVVLGTSHHEPLSRAHVEWRRHGKGAWDYARNPEELRKFWRGGIERMGNNESVVTVGMRGDGDEAMTAGTAIPLLETIVRDQRQLIAEVTKRPAEQTPQIWALYKEVQDYYDQGMQVPDDVTLLFADDNWGNIRRLPQPGRARAGGYGIYYHFDYVGGPRNYKWLNTTQIERVWEQLHLAREHGADRLWVVNVGDLKPMELPISFFLEYAWNPEALPLEKLAGYTKHWAAQQFGEKFSAPIAELLDGYTRFNARRKPEMSAPDKQPLIAFRHFHSLENFREYERIVAEYDALAAKSEQVRKQLPAQYQDAYFQLVHYPIEACANLNALYYAAARNRLYATQGRALTNELAAQARRLFEHDAELTRQFHALGNGRWNHQMDQTHIGYDNWQEPKTNVMPEVHTIELPAAGAIGVAIEGDARAWPATATAAVLPELSPYGTPSRYLDVFNRGADSFRFAASAGEPWVRVTPAAGQVSDQTRLEVSVDWQAAPVGRHRVPITVTQAAGASIVIEAELFNPGAKPAPGSFVEAQGHVAIEAAHFSRAVEANNIRWREIPRLGAIGSGVAAFPTTAGRQDPAAGTPHLQYPVFLTSEGARDLQVHVDMAPTLNFRGQGGLQYAVSIDDEKPQRVNIHAGSSGKADDFDGPWNRWMVDNVNRQVTSHRVESGGAHVVKIWLVDAGLVFQRIVVATQPLPVSQLGPPESTRAVQ